MIFSLKLFTKRTFLYVFLTRNFKNKLHKQYPLNPFKTSIVKIKLAYKSSQYANLFYAHTYFVTVFANTVSLFISLFGGNIIL